MTHSPKTIAANATVELVQKVLSDFGVRHLPVQRGGELVGVVSERNVREGLMSSMGRALSVEDVMTPAPYVVPPETPLDEVVAAMAEEKYGSAIIQEEGKVVGIFTTVDACRALRQVLANRNENGGI
ncbi:MAG: CBS domain-containing protein [Deltaproteobacteria bacterium]|nr:CBS domain-containing protein [Deltaproteobacteria bacterium]